MSTSTDYSSLRLVQFFAENDILTGIGSYLRLDLLLIQVCGNVLDRFVLRENIYLTRICCDLSHLELCRVHWNCVTSTDDSSLRLVQFFSGNDILTEIGLIYVWICCSFSCLGTFWIVLFSGRTLVYACNFRVI